ncbi:MAG: PAS domain-containing protein [Nitrososphaerota archaeon]|uniref:two-component system sensor histidine kinase NtrB n=1 Tax=Candidatus Bathycorpusculum sp. TaxID=2994959 RepID=UPI0028286152|nr:ATP-binding protein [Candidatus Termitimicrobium sp.]MCL2431085.1 ATP-binding protein [Candidatus Termitimicrobium sp.]MDR0492220.1 PAS domain-containing protein [Nitrososphaerota archaeon]
MMETALLTQKKQNGIEAVAEQPIHSNQIIYQGLFTHMSDGFVYCKVLFDKYGDAVDYIFCDLNKSFRHMTKLGDKPAVGKKSSELFPWFRDTCLEWLKLCGKVAQTGKSIILEGYCKPLDRWFSADVYCPEKGYVAMITKDITARRKTEQALRVSEKQYKKLANSIADPFFALDSCLKFNYWNKATEKFTGIKCTDVLGKHFFCVFGKNRVSRRFDNIYRDVMRTKNPRAFSSKLPKAGDGAFFEIEVYPTGNGISVLARDITERKKMQVSMEENTKRLEELVRIRTEKLNNAERLAAIGETAGMIGHDIRNPLQSIIGELFLAKDELGELPETEAKTSLMDCINAAEEQILYINKIVADLQDFAKPLTPCITETNLEEAIRTVRLTLDVPQNVHISYSPVKPFLALKTDPLFIKRILSNLIRNGIQAMETNGGELTIHAFLRDKFVIITVSDTGDGIPEDVKKNIFKPLFTTKSKGQGFGLAVVKKLAETLGGNISFETQMGRGTTFSVELPIHPN